MQRMNDTDVAPPLPPPAAAGPPPPPPPPPRRLYRSTSDRKIAGVAGGIGHYLGVDPTVVRLGFVVATFIGGIGLATYVVAWLILPKDDGTGGVDGRFDRNTTVALVLLLAALALGLSLPFDGGFVLPLVLVGAGIYLLLQPADEPGAGAPREPVHHYGTQRDAAPPIDAAPAPPREPRPAPLVTAAVVSLIALVGAGGVAFHQAGWAEVSVADVLAVSLGVIGCGLLVGAFVGRASGLILLGLLAGAALVPAVVLDDALDDGVGERRYFPQELDDLRGEYRLGVGELVVDLRGLDLEGTNQAIDLHLGVGALEVIVPEDVTVVADIDVDAGNVRFFGTTHDGWDVEVGPVTREVPAPSGEVVLDAHVGLGEVWVHHG